MVEGKPSISEVEFLNQQTPSRLGFRVQGLGFRVLSHH